MLWHPYCLARVATFEGAKGMGFSAYVFLEREPIAHVMDEGNDGPLLWRFLGDAEDRGHHEQELDKYAEGLPMEADDSSSFDEWCRDAFAVRLFEDHQNMRRLNAACKFRMVLLVPHIQHGHVPLVLPFAYDPSIRSRIMTRYGPRTIILNELPGQWWPDPGQRKPAGRGQGEEHVLGTTIDAAQRGPLAGGLPQHPPPVVGRNVRLRPVHVSHPGGGVPGASGAHV